MEFISLLEDLGKYCNDVIVTTSSRMITFRKTVTSRVIWMNLSCDLDGPIDNTVTCLQ